MKILALDSSGLVASVAYLEDGKIKGNINVNYQKTHSQTLLPMLDELVKTLDINLSEVDCIAVANGPGSFTGLRIGVATVKGLGLSLRKDIVPVSTLEALSLNWYGANGIVCPIMDARRSQVYAAAYRFGKEVKGEEVIEPVNCEISKLLEKLEGFGEKIYFTGDGVPVYREYIENNLKAETVFPMPVNAYQNAGNVAVLGQYYAEKGLTKKAEEVSPVYLRKPQAEREREALQNASN
ncbi:MAG: tRNA (adenosine(37)-N6)-threonylcarbamoyltransferase complex dimerization subunit type 1 TsaB [Lachnospiraceae bacterium]|nr:tRNA (adenosine(37)-N6)-threonylcarbamoyltransferase complex dimerization subunit type 1 TsaB [Lachnospiraceae bacterium]